MMYPLLRGLAPVALAGGLLLSGVPADTGLAQEQNAAPSAGSQTPAPPPDGAPPSRAAAPLFDPTARIKYLHDRLRVTPEQEPLWEPVAEAIRQSAQDIVPFLRERFRAKTNGSALDVLHSYEGLGAFQLDRLKAFIAVFEPLYASLSEGQKKIADAILREGPFSMTVGGVPELPAPFGSPLSYQLSAPYYGPWLWSGLNGPLLDHRPGRLPHFRGLVPPVRTGIMAGHVGGVHIGGFRR